MEKFFPEQSKSEMGEMSKDPIMKARDTMFRGQDFLLRAVESPGVVFS